MLREKPYEDQIQYLMGMCRIREAREIFNTRLNKATDLYGERVKRFNMDAAWQVLKLKQDYNEVESVPKHGCRPSRANFVVQRPLRDISLPEEASDRCAHSVPALIPNEQFH